MKLSMPIILIAVGIVLVAVGAWMFYSRTVPSGIVVTGIASNAKNGAEVATEKYGTVFIEDLPSWPPEYVGKTVEVVGTKIEIGHTIPKARVSEDGAVSQRAAEDNYQPVLFGLVSYRIAGSGPDSGRPENGVATYGSATLINEGETIAYPDFALTFLESHVLHDPTGRVPLSGTILEFRAAKDGTTADIITALSDGSMIGFGYLEFNGAGYEVQTSVQSGTFTVTVVVTKSPQ